MAKTRKSKTSNSKPKTSGNITKITKSKQLVSKDAKKVQSVSTRRSVLLNRFKFADLHQSDLESKIVWEVLNNFPLSQQLKMRTISPVWDYNVQLACKQIRSLDLRLKRKSTTYINHNFMSETSPWGNFRRSNLKNQKQFAKSNEANFTIDARKLKHSTNAALGKLFCNVEQLTIYYAVDCDNNESLFDLLRYFPKVTEFSFIAMTKIVYDNQKFFATKLFAAIADHLAPLNSLSLYFESIHSPKIDVSIMRKILPFLQNLSLCCPVENDRQMIEMMGTGLPPHLPIQRLSIRAPIFLKMSHIKGMFKRNPRLAKMKSLQLLDVHNKKLVSCLMDHFKELECLEICIKPKRKNKNKYSIEWMKIFSKLTNLKELVLVGMHPRNFDIEVPWHSAVALPTVRRLTFTYSKFFKSITQDWLRVNGDTMERSITEEHVMTQVLKDFAVNFVKQYPNLEALTYGWDFGFQWELHDLLSAKYDNFQTYSYKSNFSS